MLVNAIKKMTVLSFIYLSTGNLFATATVYYTSEYLVHIIIISSYYSKLCITMDLIKGSHQLLERGVFN